MKHQTIQKGELGYYSQKVRAMRLGREFAIKAKSHTERVALMLAIRREFGEGAGMSRKKDNKIYVWRIK